MAGGYERAIDGRQIRWARIRRICIPFVYAFELFAGALFPLISVIAVASVLGLSIGKIALMQVLLWYGAELLFLKAAGWHVSWQTAPAAIFRDLLMPILWIAAWGGGEVAWRDKAVYGKTRRLMSP